MALGRTADAKSRTYFTNLLIGSGTRFQVAQMIADSPEAQNAQVDSWYQTFLRRPADKGELALWTVQQSPVPGSLQILAGILGSSEYSAMPPQLPRPWLRFNPAHPGPCRFPFWCSGRMRAPLPL